MCSASFSRIGFVLLISLISVSTFAASASPKVKLEDVTCGKDVGLSLAEFKVKLVSTCDLSKPYSSSLSRILNEDTYFFCCQKAN
ncbi:MAG: hypothetical protein H7256_04590 [Bdellovibrio sp.]|nr:hypothetical protein [Bdellovibrio sp.]